MNQNLKMLIVIVQIMVSCVILINQYVQQHIHRVHHQLIYFRKGLRTWFVVKIFCVFGYFNEYEFEIFGDLNNVQNELKLESEFKNVKCELEFYCQQLWCVITNRTLVPTCPPIVNKKMVLIQVLYSISSNSNIISLFNNR